jgi:hypothetical protein
MSDPTRLDIEQALAFTGTISGAMRRLHYPTFDVQPDEHVIAYARVRKVLLGMVEGSSARVDRGRRPRATAVCGTEGGYMAHVAKRTTKCQPCKDAHAITQREWRARTKLAA